MRMSSFHALINSILRTIQLRRPSTLHSIPRRNSASDSTHDLPPQPHNPQHIYPLLHNRSNSKPPYSVHPTLRAGDVGIHSRRCIQHALRSSLPDPPPSRAQTTLSPPNATEPRHFSRLLPFQTCPGAAENEHKRGIACILAIAALHIHPLYSNPYPTPSHLRRDPKHIAQLLLPRRALVLVPHFPRRSRFVGRLLHDVGARESYQSSDGELRWRAAGGRADGRLGEVQTTRACLGWRCALLGRECLVRLG
jgi:hypothetical protein